MIQRKQLYREWGMWGILVRHLFWSLVIVTFTNLHLCRKCNLIIIYHSIAIQQLLFHSIQYTEVVSTNFKCQSIDQLVYHSCVARFPDSLHFDLYSKWEQTKKKRNWTYGVRRAAHNILSVKVSSIKKKSLQLHRSTEHVPHTPCTPYRVVM